jgi:energy-converting hydrogenase Eha subunit B
MATDTGGNQAVDYVWGNMPMQPDAGRGTVLDKTKDSHNIAGFGYNGYPGYTPGGVVVPNLIGDTSAAAGTALAAVGLVLGAVTGTTGVVSVQSAAAASLAALGTAVNITIA